MSVTSRTDDSVPSLSSYPPTFVTLITTFINRAEEAETRAHKALVILRAKDEQLLQLQQRMELLEKIASRLEEVMVPPLDLPQSPLTSDPGDSPHPRDESSLQVKTEDNNPSLETLYERFPPVLPPTLHRSTALQDDREGHEVVHNCHDRCQHLINGLERSNRQLREALTAESEQRVRDHDQYMVSLAAVSEAVRGLKNRENRSSGEHVEDKGLETGQHPKRRPEYLLLQALQGDRIPNSVLDQLTFVGDTAAHRLDKDSKAQSRIALVDQRELKRTVDAAESIVQALRKRLEKGSKGFKSKASKRLLCQNSSRSSKSSYHTPQSSISFKSRKYCRSFSSFFSTLQRKNKKLKLKYQRVLEKFKESMNVCGKLQDDIQQMTAKREQTTKQLLEGCTQTETSVCSLSNGGVPGNGAGRPQSSRNIHILQGRLDAAAKVMSKQCKQIQDLQQQLNTSCESIQSLKKRLSRAESSVAGKELLGETSRRQLQDLETKNLELNQELQQLKHTINRLKQELSSQTELSKNLEHEKENALQKFKDLNKCMEIKLSSLSSTLQQKEELSERATSELQVKLSSLRERLMSQTSEARDRLVDADSKIQELYLGIETFLHLLFTLSRRTSSPELSPSSQAHAVQIASDILQLPPGQVQTILDSSRTDNHQLSKWIKECNRLVHNKVFAKNLGHFLLDAVLDAKIT